MNHCTKEQLIAFERRIADLWEAGELPFLIHLSGGNEAQLIQIFDQVRPGDWVFSTHRNHYHALLSGMTPLELEEKIRAGDSMFVFGKAVNPLTAAAPGAVDSGAPGVTRPALPVHFLSSSVLAGTCCIAAGVAYAIQAGEIDREASDIDSQRESIHPERPPHVWCFLGDGAVENGHLFEAALFVEANELPCSFIIEDNNRQVETDLSTRRGGKPHLSNPLSNFSCVSRYEYQAVYPHAGSGCSHHIKFKVPNASKAS